MVDYTWCLYSKNGTKQETKPVESKTIQTKVEKVKKPLKAKTKLKSKKKKTRTKAVDISAAVKKIVLERDKGICILCNIKQGKPNMHYIARSQGGLGIEQNIGCGCIECHNDYDNGKKVIEYKEVFKTYLKGKYENWNEKDLVYRKGVKNDSNK